VEDVGVFYAHFDIFYGHLVYSAVILRYFHVLVCCTENNLATLLAARKAYKLD
jgi:hypothetical protein